MYNDDEFRRDADPKEALVFGGQPQRQYDRPTQMNQAYVQAQAPVQHITNVTDMREYAKGVVVRLPDFAPGQEFWARIRRPSMLAMAKLGQIPNSLLKAAGDLFQKGAAVQGNENLLRDMYNVCEVVCKAALVEPKFDDFKEAGLELSDQQMMAIFNYTQVGVSALDAFRKEREDS